MFLLLVGVWPGLGRVMRFGNVLRLPARKTLDVCWWEGMWCDFGDLLLVTLGVVCVGEFGGVFWLGVLLRFARGDGGVLLGVVKLGVCVRLFDSVGVVAWE